MKREAREWLRATSYSLTLSGQYADEVREELARQRAQIRDLKARLKVASRAVGLEIVPEHEAYRHSPEASLVEDAKRACVLKNKNWRKP